jgi:hypothetical protein
MHTLLMTAWLCLPLAPLNPLEQDTLADLSLHLSAGFASPNGIVSLGPDVSGNLEMMVMHPWVIRAGFDYRFGTLYSRLYPRGDLNSLVVSTDVLYYRGTSQLTGYIGLGVVYAMNHFSPNQGTSDSLRLQESVIDVNMAPQWGYRFTMGLRINRNTSLEIAVSELHPNFVFWRQQAPDRQSRFSTPTNTGSFRVSVGYVWEIMPHRSAR